MEKRGSVSVLFAGVVVANMWLSTLMVDVSSVPVFSFMHYLSSIVCGMLLYLVIKELKKTFYAISVACVLSSLLIFLILYLPAYLDIISDKEAIFFIALRQGVFTFLLNFPLGFGGAMSASILFPD